MERFSKSLNILNNPLAQTDPELQYVSLVNLKKSDEIGGRNGLDPTRYGDWEKDGRCIDF